jgi:predicted amidohydrolase YtcJ
MVRNNISAATIRDRIAPKWTAASWEYLMREIILTALVWICVALPASITLAATPAPDTILFNGKIFTSDGKQFVEALAIQGDRIEAVGDSEQIHKLAGSLTKQIDLGGRTVIPGLNDAHNHMRIRPADLVDLQFTAPNPKRPELMQAIATAVLKYPTGTFLSATISTAIFRDSTVDRATLDRVAPSHPVILTTFTGHASILNSAALTKLGIAENEPHPLGGRYERSGDGKLSGVLREYASVRASRKLADLTSDKDAIVELRETLADAAEHGITTLQVMSEKMTPARYVDLLKQVPTPLRVRIMRMPMTTSTGRDLKEGLSMPRNPSPLITVSGTKWLLDGVPIEGTFAPRQGLVSSPARRTEPFFGNLQMIFPIKELDAMLRETIQTDDQLLVHVTGYAASAAMLDAMQTAGGEKVWATRRVRFEHGDALFPNLIPRVKQLGIIVVEQGTHLDMTGIAPEVMPRIRAEKSQPMRSLLAAGIPLVLSSDEDGPSNPFLEIMLAIGHPNHPSEAISREQAVIAYTRTAAYAEFAEKEKGSLAPGKLADLAVLSQDIFTVPSDDLPKTVSVMTMVGGKMIYDAHLLRD